jgi:hypothetical protein
MQDPQLAAQDVSNLLQGYGGYLRKSSTKVSNFLDKIHPKGGRAIRDALLAGCQQLADLVNFTGTLGQEDNW